MKAVICFLLSIILIYVAIQLHDWRLLLPGLLAAYLCWHYSVLLRLKPDPYQPEWFDRFNPFTRLENARFYYDQHDIDVFKKITMTLIVSIIVVFLVFLFIV